MADVKHEEAGREPEGRPVGESSSKVFSRRDLLGVAAMGASGLFVAGATHFANNMPDAAIQGLISRGITANRNGKYFKDDALHVITTGTGAPLPDAKRAGPQAVVIAGDQTLVFDAGPGSTRQLLLTGLNVSEVDALFLTHFHSDHISDLGEFMLQHWGGAGATEQLKIYGPPGVKEVVGGFLSAYQLDRGYRIAHHGEKVMPPSGFGAVAHTFDLGKDLMSSAVVYRAGNVEVIAFNVDHPPVVPAVGFRVKYKDRSVMITGDTTYSDSLIHHARGADLMVSESLNHKMSQWTADAGRGNGNNLSSVTEDIQDTHIRPEDAARVAKEAGVPVLIITHVLPPVPDQLINPFLRDARGVYRGDLRMAKDGTLISLPVNSKRYSIHQLLA
jgi:ribonuclease Z